MTMKKSESAHPRKLKMTMLHDLPEILKLPNLTEGERNVLATILEDMVDERTDYKQRLRAFTVRQFVFDAIKDRHTPQPVGKYQYPLRSLDGCDSDCPF